MVSELMKTFALVGYGQVSPSSLCHSDTLYTCLNGDTGGRSRFSLVGIHVQPPRRRSTGCSDCWPYSSSLSHMIFRRYLWDSWRLSDKVARLWLVQTVFSSIRWARSLPGPRYSFQISCTLWATSRLWTHLSSWTASQNLLN